jgi:UDP-2-acetamido-2,6-beta-L-arabino-hexul-4-ose reductase
MKRVGITGQHGFLGQHLFNTLKLSIEDFELIDFKKEYFGDESSLDSFVAKCNVIIHLASKNRQEYPNTLYQTNISLTSKLIESLKRVDSKAHVLFSSSTQEGNGSLYGRSKSDSRLNLANWADESGGSFTGLIIPNVYGPFGNPFYNSVTATFCHQLINDMPCKIEVDSQVKLIYVGDLVSKIIDIINGEISNNYLEVKHTDEIKVSDLLATLQRYKKIYFKQGIIPALTSRFDLNLFNTFRSYIDIGAYFPRKYVQHCDERGVFSELIKINTGGQVSYSQTLPGKIRGNHFHTRKIERFSIIKGEALIQLRKVGTKETVDLYISGDDPAYVDMPIWYTHNVKNIGTEDLLIIFWINEVYNPKDPDTFFEIV